MTVLWKLRGSWRGNAPRFLKKGDPQTLPKAFAGAIVAAWERHQDGAAALEDFTALADRVAANYVGFNAAPAAVALICTDCGDAALADAPANLGLLQASRLANQPIRSGFSLAKLNHLHLHIDSSHSNTHRMLTCTCMGLWGACSWQSADDAVRTGTAAACQCWTVLFWQGLMVSAGSVRDGRKHRSLCCSELHPRK